MYISFFIILIYSGDDSSDDDEEDDDANNGSLYCHKESSPFHHGSSNQPSRPQKSTSTSKLVRRTGNTCGSTKSSGAKQSRTQRKGNKSSTNKSSGGKHSSSGAKRSHTARSLTATQRSKGNGKAVLPVECHGSSRNKKIRECTTIHTQAKSTIQGKITVSEGLFRARHTQVSSALHSCRIVSGEGIYTHTNGCCIQWDDEPDEKRVRVKDNVQYVLKEQVFTKYDDPVNWDHVDFIPDPWHKKNVQSVADVTELTEDEQMKLALEKSMDESQNVKKAAE